MKNINPELDNWQDLTSWTHRLPEFVIAATIGTVGTWGIYVLFGLSFWWTSLIWFLFSVISFGGVESATWAYLQWTSKDWPDKGRKSTLKPFNDWLAGLFGYKLYDEGYSWIWAFTKGFITTIPLFGIGGITLPLCRELASHAKSVGLPWEKNFWMEFLGDGLAYTLASIIFVLIVAHL